MNDDDLLAVIKNSLEYRDAHACLRSIKLIRMRLDILEEKAKDVIDAETECIARERSHTNDPYTKTG